MKAILVKKLSTAVLLLLVSLFFTGVVGVRNAVANSSASPVFSTVDPKSWAIHLDRECKAADKSYRDVAKTATELCEKAGSGGIVGCIKRARGCAEGIKQRSQADSLSWLTEDDDTGETDVSQCEFEIDEKRADIEKSNKESYDKKQKDLLDAQKEASSVKAKLAEQKANLEKENIGLIAALETGVAEIEADKRRLVTEGRRAIQDLQSKIFNLNTLMVNLRSKITLHEAEKTEADVKFVEECDLVIEKKKADWAERIAKSKEKGAFRASSASLAGMKSEEFKNYLRAQYRQCLGKAERARKLAVKNIQTKIDEAKSQIQATDQQIATMTDEINKTQKEVAQALAEAEVKGNAKQKELLARLDLGLRNMAEANRQAQEQTAQLQNQQNMANMSLMMSGQGYMQSMIPGGAPQKFNNREIVAAVEAQESALEAAKAACCIDELKKLGGANYSYCSGTTSSPRNEGKVAR